MDILRSRRVLLIRHAGGLTTVAKQVQTCFDVYVARIEVSSTLVRIKRICGLIVARFILDVTLSG